MIEKRVLVFQIVAFFANIAVGVVGIALPYLFKNNKNVEKIMSYLNCAAGGVLGGVSIIHILPETGATLNKFVRDFPLSFYITFAGLVVMVSLVKLGAHSHQHEDKPKVQSPTTANGISLLTSDQNERVEHEEHSHSHKNEDSDQMSNSEQAVNIGDRIKTNNKNAVVMLLIGLMIHDISEGVSLGLCVTFDDTLQMFLAIFLHKWCEQVCQAICGIREGLTFKQNMAYLIPLCMATPVSQIIAFMTIYFSTGSGEIPQTALIIQDVFMSFAAGTFIGIMFEEVIEVEMSHHNNNKQIALKILTFIGGFGIISIASVYEWFSLQ
ncbi:ZIP_zinc transporter protein [Hexamita inflata]|uniref:ZIP_zinc transporter protein n=1 Tax=Hexamita inflata TaxID=28002 RepID=A0ABP1JA25_9EUKA